ncbi:MAG: hypothetical protein ABSC15_08705 [Terriglobales bacterium]
MKKSYFIAVLALACVLGLGGSSRAQDASTIVVHVPFDFVAAGAALPAGTYSVGRVSDSQPSLFIRSYEKGALLLPIVLDGAAAEQAKLAFQHVGDMYFLSRIETPAGVYTVGTPRVMTKVAQRDQSPMSSSGTN